MTTYPAPLAGLILLTLAGFLEAAYAQSNQNVLIDLGPGTRAYGINADGQVTGCVSTSVGGTHAFFYAAGTLLDLGTLGGVNSCGLALNASGQVTGYADTSTDRHAFLYANGMMTDLTAASGMPTSNGLGINAAGDVVGDAPQFGGTSVAILYSHGVVTDLFPLNVNYVGSVATVINDAGVIAGFVSGPCGILCPTYSPFMIEGGVTTDLPTGAVFDPLPSGINTAGQIVAWGEDPDGFYHGLVYENGALVDLGANTTAYAINTSGDVVGNSNVARLDLANADVGVFLYNAGVSTDLKLPGLVPTGINDAGWIVGNHVPLNHAYLWRQSSIGLAPVSLTFGDEPISTASSQGTPTCGSCAVTLSNGSAEAIAVDNIVATQSYSVMHNCPASLAAGATCSVNVTFTPAAFGPQLGALTVGAGGTTYAALLQGSGAIAMTLAQGSAPVVATHPFTIEWQAGTGATCTGNGGSWNASGLPASGSKAIIEDVAATYTYSLLCSYGSSGTMQGQAHLVVVVHPVPSGGSGSMDQWLLSALVLIWTTRRRAIRYLSGAYTPVSPVQNRW